MLQKIKHTNLNMVNFALLATEECRKAVQESDEAYIEWIKRVYYPATKDIRLRFTEGEALEKLGMSVRTNVPWPQVPAGTIGRVIEVYGRNDWALEGTHGVKVEWNLGNNILSGWPLWDGFFAEEYRRFLTELGKETKNQ